MKTMDLANKRCIPCEGGTLPLPKKEATALSARVPDWKITEDKKLERELKFKNFSEAMRFVNRVAELAEKEGHHPEIRVSYNRVLLELTTHAIKGLSENDFILAAKIDRLISR